jgi:2-oxopent-4-enoate/cis-2-oxohex-4-enoate hydratase
MIARRLDAGEKVVGKKIGVTSKVVMNMLGVGQPDFGYLLDGMVYNEGESIPMDTLIQPKAEGEIAFILKQDLMGPGVTAADVLRATDFVMPCFEIVDSRIRTGRSRSRTPSPTTPPAACSCSATSRSTRATSTWRLRHGAREERRDRRHRRRRRGAWARRSMPWPGWPTRWAPGHRLKAGEVILSGSLAAGPVKAGDSLRMAIGGIGGCSVDSSEDVPSEKRMSKRSNAR